MTLPAPGAHGGDGWRIAAGLGLDPRQVIDLSASLNPFAPDVAARVVALLGGHPELLRAYPDGREATAALAQALGVEPERLVLTNGGAEAIALVAALAGEGMVVEPEFSLYRRHLPQVRAGAPRWRSNPANPSGRLAAAEERAAVWDEAFYPLATGRWSRGDEDAWRLGSLTKLWACPGLRLGYAIAPDAAAADRLRAHQPVWSVNGLALALMDELLAASDLPGWCTAIAAARTAFAAELRRLGFVVTDTEANWLLVEGEGLRAALAPFGVVVRDLGSFGMDGRVRVALPRPHELDRVLSAFAAVAGAR